jgi:hypothetical protein
MLSYQGSGKGGIEMAKFHALGRELSREQAYEVIVNDWIADVCEAGNSFGLRLLLLDGWVSLRLRTDEDLQDLLNTLEERPLPGEDEAAAPWPSRVGVPPEPGSPGRKGEPPHRLH